MRSLNSKVSNPLSWSFNAVSLSFSLSLSLDNNPSYILQINGIQTLIYAMRTFLRSDDIQYNATYCLNLLSQFRDDNVYEQMIRSNIVEMTIKVFSTYKDDQDIQRNIFSFINNIIFYGILSLTSFIS